MVRKRDKSAISPVTKYILFFQNFIIWVVGLAIAVLGTYVLVIKNKVVKDAFDFFLDPATIMCTAGSITVFVSFFGCMGALRENTCFLKFYSYLVSFLFLGEIALVIFVFVFYFVPDAREKLGLLPQKSMQEAIVKYGVVDDEDMVNLIDNIQRTLKCCGLGDHENGYLDWNKNIYFNCTAASKSPEKCSVPASCCKIRPGDKRNIMCGQGVMKPNGEIPIPGDNIDNIYTDGCLKALGTWINENAIVAGGVLLGILIPQMLVLCLTRNLRYQIKTQKAKWDLPENRPDRFKGSGPYYINPQNGRLSSSGVHNPAFAH